MLNYEDEHFNLEQVEKWLENYFLDPLTSFQDQTQFRIDLYETNQEWIVEAMLTDYNPSEINILVLSEKLVITAQKKQLLAKMDNHIKTRSIEFPFFISRQKITASFTNGILEIVISKVDEETGNNRLISLS